MSKFYKEIATLKNLERKGWKIRNIKSPYNSRFESDAEHTFSMCLLALEIITKEKLNLNTEKVLKMCLYHELGEIDVGDITPFDNVTKQEKYNRELACINRVASVGEMNEIVDIWKEYEENKTCEAKFVKIIDKLDAVNQAKVYAEQNNNPQIFEEFYNNYLTLIEEFKKYI